MNLLPYYNALGSKHVEIVNTGLMYAGSSKRVQWGVPKTYFVKHATVLRGLHYRRALLLNGVDIAKQNGDKSAYFEEELFWLDRTLTRLGVSVKEDV